MDRTEGAPRITQRLLGGAYPALLGVAFVMSLYVDTHVSMPQTFRTIAVAVGGTVIVQGLPSAAFQSTAAGALGAAFAWLFAKKPMRSP